MLLRFTSCRASRFKGQTSQAMQCWFSKHSCRHSSGVAGEVLRMWSPRPLRQQTRSDPKRPVTSDHSISERVEGRRYPQRLLRNEDLTDGGEREALIARLTRPCKATHRKVQQSPLPQQGVQAFDVVTEMGVSTSECRHTKIRGSSGYRNSLTES